MDGGAWWATVPEIAKSWILLSDFTFTWASLVAQMVKCLPVTWETWVRSLVREDPLEKEMATHSSTFVGKFHGWRSLVGYSPQGHKELDMTEQLHWFKTFNRAVTLHYPEGYHLNKSCEEHGRPGRNGD